MGWITKSELLTESELQASHIFKIAIHFYMIWSQVQAGKLYIVNVPSYIAKSAKMFGRQREYFKQVLYALNIAHLLLIFAFEQEYTKGIASLNSKLGQIVNHSSEIRGLYLM